jgi:hypothetical protein
LTRWAKGSARVSALIETRHLQRVVADPETVIALLESSRRHIAAARLIVAKDPESAYSVAYDAARSDADATSPNIRTRAATTPSPARKL